MGWTLGYLCSLNEQPFFFLFLSIFTSAVAYIPNDYSQRRRAIQR